MDEIEAATQALMSAIAAERKRLRHDDDRDNNGRRRLLEQCQHAERLLDKAMKAIGPLDTRHYRLKRLRGEMAALHPDKGGPGGRAFQAALRRYKAANA